METKRVPNLDWPKDLFRGAATGDAIEDPDNPFLEDSDFAPAIKPVTSRVLYPDYALAE
jgi:hypothetical protein